VIKFLKFHKSKLLKSAETLYWQGFQEIFPEILAAAGFQNKHSQNPIVILQPNNYAH